MRIKLSRISNVKLSKTFKHFEERLTGICSVVTRPTRNHAEVRTKSQCLLDSAEVRLERN
jgi:hypothetical protein